MATVSTSFDEVVNAFCPTGEGGGVDPSCGSGSSGGTSATDASDAEKNSKEYSDKATAHEEAGARHYRNKALQQSHIRVSKLYSRAADSYGSAARAFKRGDDLVGETHLDRAERFAEEAEQTERSGRLRTNSDSAGFEQVVANLGKPERRTLNGREFLVAPITIFPPGGGVMAGSKGPLFYSANVTRANARAWNHFPIVARHPVSANGVHIRADDPDVLDKQRLGFLLNDREEDGKRRVDGWYDIEATRNYDRKNGTTILNDLEAGKLIEVSTGLLTEDREVANGNHNGRGYTHEVINWTPDHLAVLPDQKGACSIQDGCGVNNAAGGDVEITPTLWERMTDNLAKMLGYNAKHEDEEYHCAECEGKPESEHCDKCKEMTRNAESLNDKQNEIQRLLTERFGKDAELQAVPSGSVYVSDLFDDSVVYQLNGVYYRLPYTGNNGKYVLGSEQPVKVDRKTDYVPATNVRSLNTGKFKRRGSGTGKGEPHERAQAGAMMLSARDRELGADAARQLAETGANPASWVADEATWDRAKEAAAKTYAEGDESYWPAVAHIYKQMGGAVKDTTDNADDAFAAILNDINDEDVVNAFCPTGEGGGVDPSCSPGEGGGSSGKQTRMDIEDAIDSGNVTEDDFAKWNTGAQKARDEDYGVGARVQVDKAYGGGRGYVVGFDSDGSFATVKIRSDIKTFHNTNLRRTIRRVGNNESGNPDDSTFNEGDSPMTMTEKQRETIVKELTTNCECWKGEEETLNEMSDDQLIKHAKAHQQAQVNAVTANAVRDVLKPPKDLKANEMPAFIKKKIAEKEGGDEEEEEEGEMMTDSEATTNTAKPANFEEFLAVAPPEWKEAVANAVKITRDQKAGIVRRLVANVREEKVRERLAAKYAKLPLGELQDMLALVPARQQRPTTNEGGLESYLGSAGSLAGNVLYSKEDELADNESIDLMTAPTFSIEDARKTA